MRVKKYPEDKRVTLQSIGRGECFMLIADWSGDEDSCDWTTGEIFMSCGTVAGADVTTVIHLETAIINMFKKDLIVEKVKAHIVCE